MNNNLYIIEEVLMDYSAGMVVIAAPNLERCREIFEEEFVWNVGEFDSAIESGKYKVLPVQSEEGIISYVFGGG